VKEVYAVAEALRTAYRGSSGPHEEFGFMFEKLDRCHDMAKTSEARRCLRALYSACEVLARIRRSSGRSLR
jgi:hypothetical protein